MQHMLADSPYTTTIPPDITVVSSRRRTVLTVECMFEKDASPPVATRLRNRLLSGGYVDVPAEAFFMLALSMDFHLWMPGASADAPPNHSVSSTPVLLPYLGRTALRIPWPGSESMQIAVSFWLSDLAASIRQPEASDAEQMLVKAGLYEQLKGGSVLFGSAP
jgi:hypothetical protein